jgi:hypothetical protein
MTKRSYQVKFTTDELTMLAEALYEQLDPYGTEEDWFADASLRRTARLHEKVEELARGARGREKRARNRKKEGAKR